MIEVVLMIPLWGRPLVAETAMQNLDRTVAHFAALGIEVHTYCTVSDRAGQELVKKYNTSHIALPNKPIGTKLDAALEQYPYDFDYYLGMGSDNILTEEAIEQIAAEMKAGQLMAGYQDMVFIKGNRMKLYHSTTMFGAGRFVHRTLLDAAMRSGEFYGARDKGLDGASFRAVKRTGYDKFKWLKGFDVIDLKGEENINGFDAYNTKELPVSERYKKYLTCTN